MSVVESPVEDSKNSAYPSREQIIVDRLVDACVAAAGEHGVDGLKMNHIIEGSGISRRTVYKYFPNKTAIVHEAYMREGVRLFEGAKQAVSACKTVEDIFVYAFLFVVEQLPGHPLMRELVFHHNELMENLDVEQNVLETLSGFDLEAMFTHHPGMGEEIYEMSVYWIQVILSFLLLGSGEGKSRQEIEEYVRKRFVPGLRLDDMNGCS